MAATPRNRPVLARKIAHATIVLAGNIGRAKLAV
jgi:hypothetical protein